MLGILFGAACSALSCELLGNRDLLTRLVGVQLDSSKGMAEGDTGKSLINLA
jgi:hypothetical protein